jgi:hypothetical protein
MTAVLGIISEHSALLAADSAELTEDGGLTIVQEPKIWRPVPSLLVGHAGGSAYGEAVQWRMSWPALPKRGGLAAWNEWIHRRVWSELYGFQAAVDPESGESLLVLTAGGLWLVDTALCGAVIRMVSPEYAIGSGGESALAALRALPHGRPRARALKALACAESMRSDVRRPWCVLML